MNIHLKIILKLAEFIFQGIYKNKKNCLHPQSPELLYGVVRRSKGCVFCKLSTCQLSMLLFLYVLCHLKHVVLLEFYLVLYVTLRLVKRNGKICQNVLLSFIFFSLKNTLPILTGWTLNKIQNQMCFSCLF